MLNLLIPLQTIKSKITADVLGALENSKNDDTLFQTGPLLQRNYDRAKAHVLEVLGDDAFESAFAEGQKMSLDEALDLVLKTVEEMDE
jgi:hypothetical protein